MQTARGSIWNELNGCTRGLEPSIGEVLSDPIIHAVMRRDGVTMPELREVIEAARHRAMIAASSDRRDTNGAGYGPVRVHMHQEDENNSSTV